MIQKVLKVGSSVAVTIPKKSLKELGIAAGDDVEVTIDKKKKIFSVTSLPHLTFEDARIARLAMAFINRYRKDLEALADK